MNSDHQNPLMASQSLSTFRHDSVVVGKPPDAPGAGAGLLENRYEVAVRGGDKAVLGFVASFLRIAAQKVRTGIITGTTCCSMPLTIIARRVTEIQDSIAAGRSTNPLQYPQDWRRSGIVLVFPPRSNARRQRTPRREPPSRRQVRRHPSVLRCARPNAPPRLAGRTSKERRIGPGEAAQVPEAKAHGDIGDRETIALRQDEAVRRP